MKKREHKPFHVVVDDVNKHQFVPYDIMPYFIYEYGQAKFKPKTHEECKSFIVKHSQYMFWSRAQWELVLKPWVSSTPERKIDVYEQIMMNIDIVTTTLMENVL